MKYHFETLEKVRHRLISQHNLCVHGYCGSSFNHFRVCNNLLVFSPCLKLLHSDRADFFHLKVNLCAVPGAVN